MLDFRNRSGKFPIYFKDRRTQLLTILLPFTVCPEITTPATNFSRK